MERKKIVLIVLAVIVFLSITGGVGVKLTSTASFCNKCHIMKDYYTTWNSSTHDKIECLKCHSDPGIIGLAKVKTKGLKELGITVLGLHASPKADVPDTRCLACHSSFPSALKKLPSIVFSHDKHRENKLKCSDCHSGVVHGQPKQLKMKVCLECHKNKKTAPVNDCFKCHKNREEIKPNEHKNLTWQVTHGQEAIKSGAKCSQCHDLKKPDNKCISCHGLTMPHENNWMALHGTKGKSSKDVAKCTKCHQPKSATNRKAVACISCHKTAMPHPANWENTHGKQVKSQRDCQYCHSSTNPANTKAEYTKQDFCNKCHQNYKHQSNWIKLHGSIANQKAMNCNQCHGTGQKQQQFCNSCHYNSNPHNVSWKQQHGDKAKQKGANCSQCHGTGQKQQQFCNSCHYQSNPHDVNWISSHKDEAFARLNDCKVCHNLVTYCAKCHK